MFNVWNYIRYAIRDFWTVHLASGTHRFCHLLSLLRVSVGFQKQLTQYTKVISHVWDIANKAREEWESEAGARTTQPQSSNAADTNSLLAAVYLGKGLKVSYNVRRNLAAPF